MNNLERFQVARCRACPDTDARDTIHGRVLVVKPIVLFDPKKKCYHKIDFEIGIADGEVLVLANPKSNQAFLESLRTFLCSSFYERVLRVIDKGVSMEAAEAIAWEMPISANPLPITLEAYIGISTNPDLKKAVKEAVSKALAALLKKGFVLKEGMSFEQAVSELSGISAV
ncbi:hypothetical protein HZC21_04270 [Candidatus Peregrinibacteria bacterium]|nr:hypothetical protein [Candidatus Peregrinibacteria bacterium]